MSGSTSHDHLFSADSPESTARLSEALYSELRELASFLVHRYRPGGTLQPTALVHEAYLRVAHGADSRWESEHHFYSVAARAMRQILVDYVRAKRAKKRTPLAGRVQALDELVAAYEDRAFDLVELHELLQALEDSDPRLARAVDLRFFAGLEVSEIAELEGVSRRTTERDLESARKFLAQGAS